MIVCRDITEQKRAEEEVSLLHTIIIEVAAAKDLAASFEIVFHGFPAQPTANLD